MAGMMFFLVVLWLFLGGITVHINDATYKIELEVLND